MEQSIEKEIHGNMPRYLKTLMDLVRIPSISFDNFDQKFVTKSAEAVKALFEKGINACIIGSTTDKNDRIIRNDDETRYLDKPGADEIVRFMV